MQKLDFTYASKNEHNIAQRFIIKIIENLSGKRKLEQLYKNYSDLNRDPINFWSDIIEIMKINVINKSEGKLMIPKDGPLMIISNHPYGIIDGIILCSIVSKFRSDFKIMTHETLQLIPELKDFILPIDFSKPTRETSKKNIETSKAAKEHLINKGAIIIFPAGSVSIAKNIATEAYDDEWKLFPAKLIQQTKANVLPVFFDGKNGPLYHLFASKIKNQTLKYSSYIYETKKKIGKQIIINSGDLIKYENLKRFNSRTEMINHLKKITYSLKNFESN